jgi:adenosine deaminase
MLITRPNDKRSNPMPPTQVHEISPFIEGLPKAELHVHLEGSVHPDTLLTLARKAGSPLGSRTRAELTDFYRFRDFPHFVETYVTVCDCLSDGADFALITEELGANAARQNIRYLEATFTPIRHVVARGIPFAEVMDGLAAGAATARRDHGVEIRFIFDHPRDLGLDAALQAADWCIAGQDRGVVALGLSGFEDQVASRPFQQAVDRARAAGLHFIPHAGEIAGPGVIWEVLAMGAERIGHGIHAIDDPALVTHLRATQTPLEVCPTSNLCTGAVPTLAAHPLRRLWDAGLYLTLNSDDPPMFNTDLLREYTLAVTAFDFALGDLARLSLNSVAASFAAPALKARLAAEIAAHCAQWGITPTLQPKTPA